ncbi:MAG: hypothetical protein PVI42_19045, partial [Desulfobacterales bacterium]
RLHRRTRLAHAVNFSLKVDMIFRYPIHEISPISSFDRHENFLASNLIGKPCYNFIAIHNITSLF